MTTWEAIKALEEGKKVRNPTWDLEKYIEIVNGEFVDDEGFLFYLSCINDNIWEIYNSQKLPNIADSLTEYNDQLISKIKLLNKENRRLHGKLKYIQDLINE